MGVGAHLALALPYLRRAHGLERLDPKARYLFIANHVSLLDTILLGALCWRSGCYPILVLGDKRVWQDTRAKRLLSGPIGFLLERGKLNSGRIRELQLFGKCAGQFHLVVFPEGTRGDGLQVGSFQPGIYFIAHEARLPVVPVFIHNMQSVSTKAGQFHPIAGLRKVEVFFGAPIPPATYLPMPRQEFLETVRRQVALLRPSSSVKSAVLVDRTARC